MLWACVRRCGGVRDVVEAFETLRGRVRSCGGV